MQTNKSTGRAKNALKKFVAVATTGAIAAIPLFGAISVSEAQPPRHAPAYGYRDKNKRKDHRNDRKKDRHNDRRRDDRWNKGRNDYRTLTGTVTRVQGSNRFDLRADGRTYNVHSSSRLPRGLDRNDVVRVYGMRSGNNDIRNARVTIIRNR